MANTKVRYPDNLIQKVLLDEQYKSGPDIKERLEYAFTGVSRYSLAALLLYYKDRKSCAEIGKELKMSEKEVEEKLTKGINQLRNPIYATILRQAEWKEDSLLANAKISKECAEELKQLGIWKAEDLKYMTTSDLKELEHATKEDIWELDRGGMTSRDIIIEKVKAIAKQDKNPIKDDYIIINELDRRVNSWGTSNYFADWLRGNISTVEACKQIFGGLPKIKGLVNGLAKEVYKVIKHYNKSKRYNNYDASKPSIGLTPITREEVQKKIGILRCSCPGALKRDYVFETLDNRTKKAAVSNGIENIWMLQRLSKGELMVLNGIGEVTAQKLVELVR